MPYQTLIVEDEPQVAKRIERLTHQIMGERQERSICAASIAEAEGILNTHEIDLILLDLNLAGENGFALLKHFTAKAAHTIVVSAQTERALEAFEFGVLDFVPKPFTQLRLEKALNRLWNTPENNTNRTRRLSFESGRGIDVVATNDILFFKGADKYSEATLKNGDTKFHGKPLNRLEHILSEEFVRTHKSYLVHQFAICDLKSLEGSRYELRLSNGANIPVGRTRVNHVRQLIERRAS